MHGLPLVRMPLAPLAALPAEQYPLTTGSQCGPVH